LHDGWDGVPSRCAGPVGGNWSDFYGHFGNEPTYVASFNAAVSKVTSIGPSFGGDSCFEDGIGTTDRSGTLALTSSIASWG
jgi:hypothetical protein